MATARWLVVTARWFCGRQVLLRLRGYISVCPTLQLSHNDVPGVGLGGCWNQVVPSHSHPTCSQEAKRALHPLVKINSISTHSASIPRRTRHHADGRIEISRQRP